MVKKTQTDKIPVLLQMYVTFEPCSFEGRTLSCALAISQEPRIQEIYISIVDRDPRNNGNGLDILKQAGKTEC
ncbi:hypothetical protein [Scytonema sp. NUACC26]|uniref:hypothetical protein n=1 Tax=Scytonema sp. NUACC26 TaxID=3140176 RepID=UPI0034DBE5DF